MKYRLFVTFFLYWIGFSALAQSPSSPIEIVLTERIPQRPADARTGSELGEIWSGMDQQKELREAQIAEEILSGNFPDFMRLLVQMDVTIPSREDGQGDSVRASYWVMPDYLMVGSDEDFLRVPMQPHTAQRIAEDFGFFLSTAKIADDLYKAAAVKLEPQPLTEFREAFHTFVHHHRLIEEQRKDRRGLIAGIKKDVISTVRLFDTERPARLALYGWHQLDGKPIQPVYTGHADHYVDYSHGFRLVWQYVLVAGRHMHVTEVLADPALREILSDEAGSRHYKYPIL